jgi:SOS-response transcriptional repressor LexA
MAAIFAIIAIYSQGLFAIVAIVFFATIANTSDMKGLDFENRRWLADKVVGMPQGSKGEVAKALGLTPTQLSRVINLTGKEARKLNAEELRRAREYFKDDPPSLRGTREVDPPPVRPSREIIRVPLLDRVPAGKLKAPISQLDIDESTLLPVADIGRGDFFALTVEGDSMDRIAPEGSTIIVNRAERTLVAGKPYVLSSRGEISFKIWKPSPPRFAPASFNPVHEPIYVKTKEAAEGMVVGRVKRAIVDL